MVWRRRGEKRRREEGGRKQKKKACHGASSVTSPIHFTPSTTRCRVAGFACGAVPGPIRGRLLGAAVWNWELIDCAHTPPVRTAETWQQMRTRQRWSVRSGDYVIGLGECTAGLYVVLASRYQAFSGMADDDMLINGRA